jgi:hypothetical protein
MADTYSFWNGKNLNGRQEYLEVGNEPDCAACAFRCVEGTETTSAADL